MKPVRLVIILALFIIGFTLAGIGNYIMDQQQPLRQQSQLLENYFLMQSLAGKNISPNLTYMVGNYGLVVSFNDVLTDPTVKYHQKDSARYNGSSILSSSLPKPSDNNASFLKDS